MKENLIQLIRIYFHVDSDGKVDSSLTEEIDTQLANLTDDLKFELSNEYESAEFLLVKIMNMLVRTRHDMHNDEVNSQSLFESQEEEVDPSYAAPVAKKTFQRIIHSDAAEETDRLSDASIDSFRPASHRGPTQPTALSLIRKRSEKSLVEYTPDAHENETAESKSDKIEKIKTRQKSNLAQAEDAASKASSIRTTRSAVSTGASVFSKRASITSSKSSSSKRSCIKSKDSVTQKDFSDDELTQGTFAKQMQAAPQSTQAMDQNRSDIIFRSSQTPTQKVTKKKAPTPDSSSSSSSDNDFARNVVLAPNTQEEKSKESSSSEEIIEESQKSKTKKKVLVKKSPKKKSSSANSSDSSSSEESDEKEVTKTFTKKQTSRASRSKTLITKRLTKVPNSSSSEAENDSEQLKKKTESSSRSSSVDETDEVKEFEKSTVGKVQISSVSTNSKQSSSCESSEPVKKAPLRKKQPVRAKITTNKKLVKKVSQKGKASKTKKAEVEKIFKQKKQEKQSEELFNSDTDTSSNLPTLNTSKTRHQSVSSKASSECSVQLHRLSNAEIEKSIESIETNHPISSGKTDAKKKVTKRPNSKKPTKKNIENSSTSLSKKPVEKAIKSTHTKTVKEKKIETPKSILKKPRKESSNDSSDEDDRTPEKVPPLEELMTPEPKKMDGPLAKKRLNLSGSSSADEDFNRPKVPISQISKILKNSKKNATSSSSDSSSSDSDRSRVSMVKLKKKAPGKLSTSSEASTISKMTHSTVLDSSSLSIKTPDANSTRLPLTTPTPTVVPNSQSEEKKQSDNIPIRSFIKKAKNPEKSAAVKKTNMSRLKSTSADKTTSTDARSSSKNRKVATKGTHSKNVKRTQNKPENKGENTSLKTPIKRKRSGNDEKLNASVKKNKRGLKQLVST